MKQTPKIQWRRLEDMELALFVSDDGDSWLPYEKSKNFVPDYLIKGGSKGFATYQNCLKLGYKLLSLYE